MTPQERQLVAELFDRLASLEPEPRDPDAERVIAEGFRRAPHAGYALVQTVLVQDEALKRANARIEELEAKLAGEAPREQKGGKRGAIVFEQSLQIARRHPEIRRDAADRKIAAADIFDGIDLCGS